MYNGMELEQTVLKRTLASWKYEINFLWVWKYEYLSFDANNNLNEMFHFLQ